MDRPVSGHRRHAHLGGLALTPYDQDIIKSQAIDLYIKQGSVDMAYCWITVINDYLNLSQPNTVPLTKTKTASTP